jgi:hypothetical protein
MLDQSRPDLHFVPFRRFCRETTPSSPDQRFAPAVAAAEFA